MEGLGPDAREQALSKLVDLGRERLMRRNPDELRESWGNDPGTQASVVALAAQGVEPKPLKPKAVDG